MSALSQSFIHLFVSLTSIYVLMINQTLCPSIFFLFGPSLCFLSLLWAPQLPLFPGIIHHLSWTQIPPVKFCIWVPNVCSRILEIVLLSGHLGWGDATTTPKIKEVFKSWHLNLVSQILVTCIHAVWASDSRHSQSPPLASPRCSSFFVENNLQL